VLLLLHVCLDIYKLLSNQHSSGLLVTSLQVAIQEKLYRKKIS